MTIGDVFARAWDLWRRSVGWLILAGLLVGIIMMAASWVMSRLLVAVGLSSFFLLSGGSTSMLGRGAGGLAVVMLMAGGFLFIAVGVTFYGGMFEMVLGAYRQNRPIDFVDLFSGFRRLGAYALFALSLAVIGFLLTFLSYIPFGFLIALVVEIWLAVSWLYVVPLIADHGVGFREAVGKSMQMVKNAGWWWTFGMVLLLSVAIWIGEGVLIYVAMRLAMGNGSAGSVLAVLLGLAFVMLVPPYVICYVCVLYLGSGGEVAAQQVNTGAAPSYAPAPPAPPAFGAPVASGVAGQAVGGYGAAATQRQGGDDAWKAAADPLAGLAPAPPLAPPASGVTPGAPASDAGFGRTGVTDAATPAAPEPPAPPGEFG